MDSMVFILLGLGFLAVLILGPVGFFRAGGLKNRIDLLEKRLRTSEITIQMLELRLLKFLEQEKPAQASAPVQTEAPPIQKTGVTVQSAADAPAEPVAATPPEPEVTARPEQPPQDAIAAARAEIAASLPTPAPGKSWEEKLGARWAVIIGGLALSVGLLLLVRIAIERGLFGPAARVAMALALSAALAGAGEWLRRREIAKGENETGQSGTLPIPVVLTAAGTIGAFGAVYAAHALYNLIGPATAFILLGATGIAAMLAAALHGPALAGIGLLASLATPLLVSSNNPSPWPVLVYIAIVSGAAYWLARTRRWLWLALAAAAGAALWAVLLTASIHRTGTGPEFFAGACLHITLHLGMALYVFAWPFLKLNSSRISREATGVATGLALIGILTLLQGAIYGQFGVLWVLFAVAITAALALAGTRITPVALLVPAAGLFVAALTRVWPRRIDLPDPGHAIESIFLVWIEPASPFALAAMAGVLALAVFALAADRLRSEPALPVWAAVAHAATAAATPVGVLGLLWLRQPWVSPHFDYAFAAGLLAVLYTASASVFRRLPAEGWASPGKLGVGFFATGALSSLALGFTIALDGGHLTVALALTALAAAWISVREDLPVLRWCVAVIGAILAARLAWDPRIVGAALSTTPIFNWLLVGYGVPALCFAAASKMLRREPEDDDLPQQVAEALAILFFALLCFFEIRHALNGGDPFAKSSKLIEYGLQMATGLALAVGLTKMTTARKSRVINVASLIFGYGTMGVGSLGLLFFVNPYLERVAIEGSKWLNSLTLAYALPALLAAILARLSIGRRPEPYRMAAAITAILFAFTYVNLQTRRVFHADTLYHRIGFKDVEIYSYSAVWLVLGLALLAYGVIMRSREARIGSAALVVMATLKVFLIDISGLDGALRALSFIGLGLVLIGIGFVYQKLLFSEKNAGNPPE